MDTTDCRFSRVSISSRSTLSPRSQLGAVFQQSLSSGAGVVVWIGVAEDKNRELQSAKNERIADLSRHWWDC